MSAHTTIRYEEPEPGIGLLTLNRPERLNAIVPELIEELHDRLEQLEHDTTTRALILTGAGKGFCAGYDLKAAHAGHTEGTRADSADAYLSQRRLADIVTRMRRIPQPIIAAVNGVAAGGGFRWRWRRTCGSRGRRRGSWPPTSTSA